MANISLPTPGQKPWSLNPAILAMNDELNGRLSEAGLQGKSATLNVSDRGADSSGSTLSTSVLQTTLNSAAAFGFVAYIPAGTYLTDTLTVPASARVEASPNAILRLAPGAARTLLVFNGASAIWRGGRIDGNSSNQTNPSGRNVIRVLAANVTLDSIHVSNANNYSIVIQGSRATIKNCTVLGGDAPGIFVQPDQADIYGVLIESNTVDRSMVPTAQQPAIQVRQSSSGALKVHDTRVINNYMYMPDSNVATNSSGLEVAGGGDGCTVIGNYSRGAYLGLSVAAGAANNVSITGNVVVRALSLGIEVSGVNHATVSGNIVDAEGLGVESLGIVVWLTGSVTSDGVSVTGNTITGTTSDGIRVQQSERFTIVGNTIIVTASASYAIGLNRAKHGVVSGNLLDGNSTAAKALMLDRSDRISVTGNTVRRFVSNLVTIYSATAGDVLDRISLVGNVVESVPGGIVTQLSNGAVIGSNVLQKSNTGIVDCYDLLAGVYDHKGTGSPEGVHAMGIGSTFRRTNGAPGRVLYEKVVGTANTGWAAVGSAKYTQTKTASYTLLPDDQVVIFDGSSLTATLPDPGTAILLNRVFTVKNINSSSLILNSSGSAKTIDGASNQSIPQWGKLTVISNGSQWLTI